MDYFDIKNNDDNPFLMDQNPLPCKFINTDFIMTIKMIMIHGRWMSVRLWEDLSQFASW